MLDAFAVGRGGRFTNPQREKERSNDFVTLTTLASEFTALNCEFERLIRFRSYVTVSNQTRDGIVDCCVRDMKSLGEIVRSAESILMDDLRNRLDVVFRYFRRVIRSRSLVDIGHVCALNRCIAIGLS